MNAVLTKMIKRYLQLPVYTPNALVHHILQTTPLSDVLEYEVMSSWTKIIFPRALHGVQMTTQPLDLKGYDPIPFIPTYFWHSQIYHHIPQSSRKRKNLMRSITDIDHQHLCKKEKFHTEVDLNCVCSICHQYMPHFHKCNIP